MNSTTSKILLITLVFFTLGTAAAQDQEQEQVQDQHPDGRHRHDKFRQHQHGNTSERPIASRPTRRMRAGG